jgi:hypothetical protein
MGAGRQRAVTPGVKSLRHRHLTRAAGARAGGAGGTN